MVDRGIDLHRSISALTQSTCSAVLLIFLYLIKPDSALGLTSGPTQPEFSPWAPTDNKELVDLFTGDFQYSIPLFEVPGPNGGYPIVLSYRSGITIDQEASWVGLGWTLNPGAITRQVRGLPDDFHGGKDKVISTYRMVPVGTIGVGGSLAFKLFGGDAFEGSLGLQRYYNTLRGFGWATSTGINGQYALSGGQLRSLGGSLTLSYDTQQGASVGASASLSLSDQIDAGVSVDFAQSDGLKSFGLFTTYYSKPVMDKHTGKLKKESLKHTTYGIDFGGYVSPGYIPDAPYDIEGLNIDWFLAFGPEAQGAFPNGQVRGFSSVQGIKNPIAEAPAFGYLYSLAGANSDAVLDFYREKEGPVWDHSPVLPTPILTHDLYIVAGSDIGGTFRAYRNDIPFLSDKRHTTSIQGYTVGFDLGAGGYARFGLGGTFSRINSIVGPWDNGPQDDENQFRSKVRGALESTVSNSLPERRYFKFIGEPTANVELFDDPNQQTMHLAGDKPIRVDLKEEWVHPSADVDNLIPYRTAKAQATFVVNSDTQIDINDTGPEGVLSGFTRAQETSRNPRTASIQSLTNGDIIQFRDALAGMVNYTDYSPVILEKHPGHIGAFIITGADGTRHVYGLALYNFVQHEVSFSVGVNQTGILENGTDQEGNVCLVNSAGYRQTIEGTDEYLHIKEITPYAYTYLLTAILGPDYVDLDGTPGPSNGDPGYWVKFTYTEPETYKWRAPFFGATFVKGFEKAKDDKGTFTYGEKEVRYLKKIETRSHIANFDFLTDRDDARGATAEVQDRGTARQGRALKRLNQIELYAKTFGNQNKTIKTIKFQYDYSLTPKTPNSVANDTQGKLTLRSLTINEFKSWRGDSNPYEFRYSTENPNYDNNTHDWWGTYRRERNCGTFPYTQQSKNEDDIKAMDRKASAWNLIAVGEPSGAKVSIEYERDRYGYVQDKEALQLYGVVALGDQTIDSNKPLEVSDSQNRIYVQLEKSVAGDNEAERNENFERNYLDGSGQVYFKIRSFLKTKEEFNLNDDYMASISGYFKVKNAGVCLNQCPGGRSNLGWIEPELVDDEHPFKTAAEEHLRLQEPDKLHQEGTEPPINSKKSPVDFMPVGLTLANQVVDIISDARKIKADLIGNIGREIDGSHSWIRLKVADGEKFGGDSRVKSIIVNDAWCESTGSAEECGTALSGGSSETSQIYGWKYEYVTKEGKSSGVAANEPNFGGEENPLHFADAFKDERLLRSDHNLFYEEPLNHGYYPAPAVGYSRVVKSNIAARLLEEKLTDQAANQAVGRPALPGPTVYEFYTAKDFPSKADRTRIQRKGDFAPIPIPFIGMITLQTKSWSQGQSIVLNDMHGKAKRISHYPLSDSMQPLWDSPIRSEEYKYDETVDAIDSSSPLDIQALQSQKRKLGRSEELFVDMRKYKTVAQSIGVDPGVDTIVALYPLPIPIPWLNITYSLQEVKIAVVNKVIHQTHVLVRTDTHEHATLTRKENRYFDTVTGKPVITTRDNNFGAPIYDFSIPGFWIYEGMGPEYMAGEGEFSASLAFTGAGRRELSFERTRIPLSIRRQVIPGTELLAEVHKGDLAWSDRLTVTRVDIDKVWLRASKLIPEGCSHCPGASGVSDASLRIFRGGSRNLLTLEAGKVIALKDPLEYESNFCVVKRPGKCNSKNSGSDANALVIPPKQLAGSLNQLLKESGARKSEVNTSKRGTLHGLANDGKLRITAAAAEKSTCDIQFRSEKGKLIDPRRIERVEPEWHLLKEKTEGANDPGSRSYRVKLLLKGQKKAISADLSTTCTEPAYVVQPSETKRACMNSLSENYAVLDNVIEAAAIKYDWPSYDLEDYRLEDAAGHTQEDLDQADPYEIGNAGIWRPRQTLSYLEDRQFSTPPRLREDGTFDGVTMYDWGLSPADSCVDRTKWQENIEITRYSPYGHAIEEKDRLGIYSAALYGYRSSVPIAVAKNAGNDEIGFEGFEEFAFEVRDTDFRSGNIRFFNRAEERTGRSLHSTYSFPAQIVGKQIKVLASQNPPAANNLAKPSKPKSSQAKPPAPVKKTKELQPLSPQKQKTEENPIRQLATLLGSDSFKRGGKIRFSPLPSCPSALIGRLGTRIDLKSLKFNRNLGSFDLPTNPEMSPDGPDDDPRRGGLEFNHECPGKIDIQMPGFIPRPQADWSVSVSEDKAHSGRRSLKVERPAFYEQSDLKLVPGKQYLLSVWVSREDTDVPSIVSERTVSQGQPAPDLRIRTANTHSLIPVQITLSPMIEGWQKIEKMFVAPAERIEFEFVNDGESVSDPVPAFFDDVRIQPVDAGMKNYVYDPDTYELVASLDENHFATFFYYDEQGGLYLINQETVRGIYSVQEGRSHLRERSVQTGIERPSQ